MAEPARSARRLTRRTVSVALVAVSAVLVVLASQSLAPSSKAGSPIGVLPSDQRTAPPPSAEPTISALPGEQHGASSPAGSPIGVLPRQRRGALGEADGVLPAGTTVSDDALPGVARLEPDLLAALRQAAADAAHDGVEILVTSGWRSLNYQTQLFRQAVTKYGSPTRAAKWVADPGTSAHEWGGAVDIGPSAAMAWLSEHGATYGLCQIYRNEPWHYELRPRAIDHGCPPMYADPSRDPRMQR